MDTETTNGGDLGALIRRWRVDRGLSQAALAERAGIAASSVSRWEAGCSRPRIPELEAALGVLGVSRTDAHHALRLLGAPRAYYRLRDGHARGEGPEAHPQPPAPAGGDLLRAMRLRRGTSQADLAARVGVAQNAIARWERGDSWPDATRLHSLCLTLEARPEEVAALTVGRFSFGSLLGFTDPDELHVEQWRLWVKGGDPSAAALRDLRYLALEARLHQLTTSPSAAVSRPGAAERLRRILSWTYSRHAQFLRESGRVAEAVAPARNAIALQKPLWATRDNEGWVPALISLAAEQVRRAGGSPAACSAGAAMLQSSLAQIDRPNYRGWVLTQGANYLLGAGQADAALALSAEALRAVEEGDGASIVEERWLRRRDHAENLVAAGRPREAVALLGGFGGPKWGALHVQEAKELLTRASVATAIGDLPSAGEALRQLYTLFGSPGPAAPEWVAPLRERADRLSRLLS